MVCSTSDSRVPKMGLEQPKVGCRLEIRAEAEVGQCNEPQRLKGESLESQSCIPEAPALVPVPFENCWTGIDGLLDKGRTRSQEPQVLPQVELAIDLLCGSGHRMPQSQSFCSLYAYTGRIAPERG
ncbi:hypothetical protein KIL84_003550 [Mauremys mutica]|uniref:Uncharacterized protein n=1 Tax=Mauremys mutica TaxID=74926 RepID=A0A9D3WTZ2_9SAUR|nr:hypothetical protein KIL84_003550 [Mauremys mutica]